MTEGSIVPLDPAAVEIHGVQFVGTNVEMTWLLDAPGAAADAAADADPEPRLQALLAAKLGLYAVTRTGSADDGRPRFSVMASPLDRLFHTIGPKHALTVIKHASVTMELSDTMLDRQAQGLMTRYPGPDEDASPESWRPWDTGKLLGTWIRRPALAEHGSWRVGGVETPRGDFPNALLPELDAHVSANDGGVHVVLPRAARAALAS